MGFAAVLLAAVIACSLAVGQGNAEPVPFRNAQESDITYLFYNNQNPEGLTVNFNELTSASSLGNAFNSKLATVVLIHGWKDDNNANFNSAILSALLQTSNVNVIVVDWSPLANLIYLSAKNSVPSVGKIIAEFLIKINNHYRYSYNKVTLVGFSLGAHIAGCTGAALGGTVSQIIGLDPAGPLISRSDTAYSLDPTDGQYVTGIHTNAGLLGMVDTVGHSDYYVNGGSWQNGCIGITGTCSHNRVWEYFAESIINNKFVAQQCDNYSDYTSNKCTGSKILMGGYPVDEKALGTYYLNTNRRAPFGTG